MVDTAQITLQNRSAGQRLDAERFGTGPKSALAVSTRLNHSGLELISWAVLNIKSELPWDASEFLRLNLSFFDPGAFIDFRQQASVSRRILWICCRWSLGQTARRKIGDSEPENELIAHILDTGPVTGKRLTSTRGEWTRGHVSFGSKKLCAEH